jgi:methoxymalonate biosynthesis acyl carrier protein
MEEKIRNILSGEFGLMADGLRADQPIFSSGLLDSLSSLRLVMSLEKNFDVRVSPLDISLDDVDTINGIAATVTRLKD